MSKLKIRLVKLFVVLGVICIDLVTKEIFFGTNFVIIPYIIGTRSVGLNTGGAWSVLSDATWVLILCSVVFLIVITVFDFFYKTQSRVYSVGVSFIIGGAIGNLIDRIFLQGVRDFVFFEFWASYPTFNMADTFLIIGIVLIFVYVLFFQKTKENNQESKLSNVSVDEKSKTERDEKDDKKQIKQTRKKDKDGR